MIPSSANDLIRPRISTMPAGSRPLVGSSRISSSGPAQHGRRDAEPLLHAQRVGAVLVPGPGQQAGPVQHRVDRGEREPSQPGQRLQVVPAAQLRVERGRLDERADLVQVARGFGEAAAEDRAAPGGRADQAEQHPDGGGLAGPVRADEPADRPRRDSQRHVIHHGAVAEALGQPGRQHGQRPGWALPAWCTAWSITMRKKLATQPARPGPPTRKSSSGRTPPSQRPLSCQNH